MEVCVGRCWYTFQLELAGGYGGDEGEAEVMLVCAHACFYVCNSAFVFEAFPTST